MVERKRRITIAELNEKVERNSKLLAEHTKQDAEQFSQIHEALYDISVEQGIMKNTHLANIEKCVSSISKNMGSINDKLDVNTKATLRNTTDNVWLKWAIMTAGVAIIGGVIGLLFK